MQFQTLAEVAYTSESLRWLCGRSEPAQPIPRSNTGAAFGGKGALQFRRAIVTGVDFPTRRHYIRSTTGGQELVRGRIQCDDRTVSFQLCRGDHSSEYLTYNKINAKSERIECLCEIRHNFANFCILFWYRFYRMMAPCERHRRKLTKDRHEPNSTSSLRLILNCLWWKVSWNLNFLNSSIVSQLYFTIKSYLKSWIF